MLIFFTFLFSFQVKSQDFRNSKVNLDLRNATLKEAFAEIQKQSGIRFIYDQDINQYVTFKITHSEKDMPVKNAIELVLKGTNLQYVPEGGHVMISEKPINKKPSPNAGTGQGTGSIRGRIVEAETSEPLPGATVVIAGTQLGTTSDANGYYQFAKVPAGKYTMEVSFIGYVKERVEVRVQASGTATYDVKLSGDNRQIDEVVVSGVRRERSSVPHATEKIVVQEIKSLQAVVSGISSEQISRSADRNAAQVVQKIAGVTIRDDKYIVIRGLNERYNLTYLNDNIAPSTELYTRAFALDLIPTRIIDKILVFKSPAPDLLADMTGGAVKITTKDAKSVKHFDMEFQVGYREGTTFSKNFLTYNGGKTDWLGFDDGTRALPSSVPGYGDFTKANISQKTYAETFNPTLTYGKRKALPNMQLTANYYDAFLVGGKYLSSLTSFSYKYEQQHADVDRTQGNITFNSTDAEFDPGGSGYLSATTLMKRSTESRNSETAQLSLLQNFSYQLNSNSNVYFKNFLMLQGTSSTTLRNTFTNQMLMDSATVWADENPSTDKRLRDIILSWQQRFLYSGNIGGKHESANGRHQLDWNAGFTHSRLDIPDQRAIHLQNNTTKYQYPNIGEYELNWIPVYRTEAGDFADGNGTNNIELGMISRLWTRNTENVLNGSADYTFKWRPWLTVKLGTYHQWKKRQVFRRVYTVNEGDVPASGYSFENIGATNPDMDYNLVFFNQQDLGEVWSANYLRDDGTGLKVFDRTTGADAYTATEQNNSGYAALNLTPFNGKLDIYGGVRMEYDRQKIAGALAPGGTDIVTRVGGVNTPVLADLKATRFFPSVNISYRPDSAVVIRTAYGETLNRPEFRELSPYSELDYQNNENIQGNADLVFATVKNYDARIEFYPRKGAQGEMISLGAFYKEITNPIERVISKDFYNAGGYAASISFMNADRATVKGVEVDIRKSFDFIPLDFFRNLFLIANGALMESKVTRQDTLRTEYAVDRQLQGQAPYMVNIALSYENPGWGTKFMVSANQIGPRIYAASLGNPSTYTVSDRGIAVRNTGSQGSLIEVMRRQLDLSLTQRIGKGLQVKLGVQNLLDDPIQVAEDANFTYKYEKAEVSYVPQTSSGSVHKNYGRVKGDLLYSDYKPGRFFNLSMTYSF